MKAIINGKQYDTDKAEIIATIRHEAKEDPRNSFDATHWKLFLCRTENHNYFSVETGGILNWRDRDDSNEAAIFEPKFKPLSENKAIKLLEYWKLYAELEQHFGDKIEDA